MKEFEKTFTVAGTDTVYTVKFIYNTVCGIKAHCNCQAGEHKTLCKHVWKCIEEDKEISAALDETGLAAVYEEHLQKEKEAEKIKRESKNLKKKFSRLLLE